MFSNVGCHIFVPLHSLYKMFFHQHYSPKKRISLFWLIRLRLSLLHEGNHSTFTASLLFFVHTYYSFNKLYTIIKKKFDCKAKIKWNGYYDSIISVYICTLYIKLTNFYKKGGIKISLPSYVKINLSPLTVLSKFYIRYNHAAKPLF